MLQRRVAFAILTAVALSSCRGAGTPSLPAVGGAPQAMHSASRGANAETNPDLVPIGPFGLPGKVNALAIDPANPKTLYLASGRGTGLETYSSAGTFKSTTGGGDWVPIDKGLTDPTGAISSVVNALWIDPAQPNTLLAATEYDGLFRSTNAGASWTSVYRTTRATQIVSYGSALYATSTAGILTSSDDGATWRVQLRATSTRQPTAFGAVQGTKGNAFYAGMTDGTIYSFDGSAWKQVGKLPYTPDTGTDGSTAQVHQIAVDPLVPTTVYANQNDGPWDQNLHASTDGGHTWVLVENDRELYDYGLGSQAIAFSAVHPHRLYVGTDGLVTYIDGNGKPDARPHLAARVEVIDERDIIVQPNGKDDACYLLTDQGADYVPACSKRTNAYNDKYIGVGISTALARRFIVSPNQKTIIVSLQDWDSLYTTAAPGGWRFNNAGLYEDGFNELQPGSPSVCYAYDEAYGLRVSTNGCVTYAKANGMQSKIFPSRLMTTPIAFSPNNPQQMYVVSGSIVGAGFAPDPQAVFESTDGGTTLTQLNWPLSEPGAIWVDQTNANHILVGDMRHGKSLLRVTFDGGKTWATSAGVPATQFWYAMTTSPVNGNLVLASSCDASNNVFVLRSRDGGKTFQRIGNVTNAPLIRGRIDADDLRKFASRAQAGADKDADSSPKPAFVYSPEREIRYNQDVKSGHPAVVITTLRGAFISTNDGTSWRRLDHELISHSFWGIRWVNGYLYLASDGQGIVKSTTPVQTP